VVTPGWPPSLGAFKAHSKWGAPKWPPTPPR
jgi:hypothetical protein